MSEISANARPGSLAVTRVTDVLWILRPQGTIAGRTVARLRDAFLEAVDCGAREVVVDLSAVESVAEDGATTIAAMSDDLLGRGGAFWIAARGPEDARLRLRPVAARGPEGLRGMASVLDAAMAREDAPEHSCR